MAPVKVGFSDKKAQPPVYVAGSFTQWNPVELDATVVDGEHLYENTFDLEPGTYQYKFRLGPGDWWVCDQSAPLTRDDAGMENNELVVEAKPAPVEPTPVVEPAAPVATKEVKPQVDDVPSTRSVEIPEVKPEPVKVESEAPVVKPTNTTTSIHAAVTEAPAPTSEKSDKPVNGHVVESAPAPTTVAATSAPTEKPKTVSSPSVAVNGTAAPKPAAPEADSSRTSNSSVPIKEKKDSIKKEEQPEKLSWFSRIFLCGSSRK